MFGETLLPRQRLNARAWITCSSWLWRCTSLVSHGSNKYLTDALCLEAIGAGDDVDVCDDDDEYYSIYMAPYRVSSAKLRG